MRVYLLDAEKIDDYDYNRIFLRQTLKRKKKSQRFLKKEDAQRCIYAGALIKYFLKKETNYNDDPEIVYNKYGKPRFKDIQEFFFNISHSGKWVVLASSTNEVGVDIQKIVNKKYNISSIFFSPQEYSYILEAGNLAEQNRRFSEIWSLKECYLKYRGIGFAYGGNKISINPANMYMISDDGYAVENLYLRAYTFLEDYILTICGNDPEIDFEFVDKKCLF